MPGSDYREYKVVQWLGNGLAAVQRTDHLMRRGDTDTAIWSLANTRKATRCAATGEEIPKGMPAWRPVGNQQYRMERLAAGALERG